MINIKTLSTAVCSIFLLLLLSSGSHKFYVSLTEVHFIPDKNSIQVSMRIFPDDLDRALESIHGINPQLATDLEHEKGDEWLSNYLRQHFTLASDTSSFSLEYLGKEAEGDAIWCYLEGEYIQIPQTLYVRNSLLTSTFDDQKNILQVYYGDFNKGLLFDQQNQEQSLHIE